MKTLSVFVLVLVGVVVWQYTRIAALTEQLSASKRLVASLEELLKPRPLPPKPTSDIQHITCPLCHGLRVLLYNNGRNKDNCPLCVIASKPVGYRDVRVDPDHKLCPNCGGMGKIVVDETTHPAKTENCVLCAATGVVPK